MVQNATLQFHVELDRESLERGRRQEAHLVVRIDPLSQGIETNRPSLSTVFVLDVSGSMTGPPLEHVIQSVDRLIELFDTTDRVGVVAFSDSATVVTPLQPLTPQHRRLASRRVHRLESQGQTSIEAGLRLAAGLFQGRNEHERQSMMLLSDGKPNVGMSRANELGSLAATWRPDISIASLGFGEHHDEDILHAISSAGSGDYYFISDPRQADHEFACAVGAQGDVVADGVELVISPNDQVEVGEVLSHHRVRFGPKGLVIPLPDLLENRPLFVVAQLTLTPPAEPGSWDALEVTLRYRDAGKTEEHQLRRPLAISVGLREGALREEATIRVLLARAEIVRRQARSMADRGNFEGAAAAIRAQQKEIEECALYRAEEGQPLFEAVEQLVDEAMAYERRPSQESYRQFRKHGMGVDLQQDSTHSSDRPYTSHKSITIGSMITGAPKRASLVQIDGPNPERRYPLQMTNTIGRSSLSNIAVFHQSLSRRHAQIFLRQGTYLIQDLGSTNATLVNGVQIRTHELRDGDVITIGEVVFRYEVEK
jgi:Ca-activated chloride channel family protein